MQTDMEGGLCSETMLHKNSVVEQCIWYAHIYSACVCIYIGVFRRGLQWVPSSQKWDCRWTGRILLFMSSDI